MPSHLAFPRAVDVGTGLTTTGRDVTVLSAIEERRGS